MTDTGYSHYGFDGSLPELHLDPDRLRFTALISCAIFIIACVLIVHWLLPHKLDRIVRWYTRRSAPQIEPKASESSKPYPIPLPPTVCRGCSEVIVSEPRSEDGRWHRDCKNPPLSPQRLELLAQRDARYADMPTTDLLAMAITDAEMDTDLEALCWRTLHGDDDARDELSTHLQIDYADMGEEDLVIAALISPEPIRRNLARAALNLSDTLCCDAELRDADAA